MLYSDISPRTQAYADRRLLTRAKTNNILGQFGQARTLPMKSTQTIRFRRYNRLAAATTPLAEGVTPSGKTLTKTDVTTPVLQYGDFVTITDVIQDTHEDPVLQESTNILGEQAADTWDILRAGVLKSGTNVLYANGADRSAVNQVASINTFRTAIRLLKRQETKMIRERQDAGPNIGTSPLGASYVCVMHADAQPDIQALTGFIHVFQYANPDDAFAGEIGSIPGLRFVVDNNVTPWVSTGDAPGTTLSTNTTNSDVYPLLIFGADAYGIVSLGGKNSVSTYVNNPKAITGDELAQRGSVGWKGWTATAILNDAWMIRIETALNG